MVAIKVEKKKAEKVKKFLLKENILDLSFIPEPWGNYVLFPVLKGKGKVVKKKFSFIEVVQFVLAKKKKKMSLLEKLSKVLTKKQLSLLPRAYEQVGDILIMELPDELVSKEKVIGSIYLNHFDYVKTVVRKTAIHSGAFRTRKVKVVAGEKRKDTIHTESGFRVKVNVEQMYFSARLAEERLRVSKLIGKNENVLVMFSGCGIYPIGLAKHSSLKKITGIEINPVAHKYAIENIQMNKLNNVQVIQGDVWKQVPLLKGKFDRICMPLPKTSEFFLPLALKKVKKNGMVHLYYFINDNDFDVEKKKIKGILNDSGRKTRILRTVKCGNHAPYVYRYCFDIKVY